jgi:hypothetical protein
MQSDSIRSAVHCHPGEKHITVRKTASPLGARGISKPTLGYSGSDSGKTDASRKHACIYSTGDVDPSVPPTDTSLRGTLSHMSFDPLMQIPSTAPRTGADTNPASHHSAQSLISPNPQQRSIRHRPRPYEPTSPIRILPVSVSSSRNFPRHGFGGPCLPRQCSSEFRVCKARQHLCRAVAICKADGQLAKRFAGSMFSAPSNHSNLSCVKFAVSPCHTGYHVCITPQSRDIKVLSQLPASQ